jgi:hypothetical protein
MDDRELVRIAAERIGLKERGARASKYHQKRRFWPGKPVFPFAKSQKPFAKPEKPFDICKISLAEPKVSFAKRRISLAKDKVPFAKDESSFAERKRPFAKCEKPLDKCQKNPLVNRILQPLFSKLQMRSPRFQRRFPTNLRFRWIAEASTFPFLLVIWHLCYNL